MLRQAGPSLKVRAIHYSASDFKEIFLNASEENLEREALAKCLNEKILFYIEETPSFLLKEKRKQYRIRKREETDYFDKDTISEIPRFLNGQTCTVIWEETKDQLKVVAFEFYKLGGGIIADSQDAQYSEHAQSLFNLISEVRPPCFLIGKETKVIESRLIDGNFHINVDILKIRNNGLSSILEGMHQYVSTKQTEEKGKKKRKEQHIICYQFIKTNIEQLTFLLVNSPGKEAEIQKKLADLNAALEFIREPLFWHRIRQVFALLCGFIFAALGIFLGAALGTALAGPKGAIAGGILGGFTFFCVGYKVGHKFFPHTNGYVKELNEKNSQLVKMLSPS